MPVSPVSFFLQDYYTNDGKKGKKSNIAKTLMPLIATPVLAKKLSEISKSELTQNFFKINKSLLKSNKAFCIASLIGDVLAAIGLGTLIDGAANKAMEPTSFKGSDTYRACNKKQSIGTCQAHQG